MAGDADVARMRPGFVRATTRVLSDTSPFAFYRSIKARSCDFTKSGVGPLVKVRVTLPKLTRSGGRLAGTIGAANP